MMHENIKAKAAKGTASTYLALDGVAKHYGSAVGVAKFDLAVEKGELIALLGPSGCGKTTTLRMIAGLIEPTQGRIVVGGRDVTQLAPYDRDMGLVFQSYALFPHMSVAKNVAFGLQMRKLPADQIAAKVKKALEMVQLSHLAERRPRELSGGQQQRVALARALVIEPSILLLDEPLSNLDAKLRDEMRAQIRDIQQQLGITTVFVTHDQVEALSMCDRIVVMRGGLIEQVGTPLEIYERPATPFVANFVGRTNRFTAVREGERSVRLGSYVIKVASEVEHREVEVMVRPHRISVVWDTASAKDLRSDTYNRVQAKLARMTFVGDIVQYDFDAGGRQIVVEQSTIKEQMPHKVGDKATLTWRVEDTLVFGS